MPTSRRVILFVVAAVLAAAVFVRLGIWQIDRLHQRQALNAVVASRLDSGVVAPAALPRDPDLARYRRVHVEGRPDYAHELVIAARTNQGAPGVWLLTPVRVPGSDTAVVVNRGWVYSPDAASVDQSRWIEGDSLDVEGYVLPFEHTRGTVRLAERPRTLRGADSAAVLAAIPYPVLPYMVVALADSLRTSRAASAAAEQHPERLPIPPLDEGPHRSYAIQWFSFAAIALAGALMVVLKERTG